VERVLNKSKIEALQMGGLLAVNKGSESASHLYHYGMESELGRLTVTGMGGVVDSQLMVSRFLWLYTDPFPPLLSG